MSAGVPPSKPSKASKGAKSDVVLLFSEGLVASGSAFRRSWRESFDALRVGSLRAAAELALLKQQPPLSCASRFEDSDGPCPPAEAPRRARHDKAKQIGPLLDGC